MTQKFPTLTPGARRQFGHNFKILKKMVFKLECYNDLNWKTNV